MGYPIFGKVKTIVLPYSSDYSGIDIFEYKERYGIDLRDVFNLVKGSNGKGYVMPKDPSALLLTRSLDIPEYVNPTLKFCGCVIDTQYDHDNSTDLVYKLGAYIPEEGGYQGLELRVESTDDFTWENVSISVTIF